MKKQIPVEPLVMTIGNFDGVHIGHQSIIKIIKLEASKRDARPCAMIFIPHTMGIKTILTDDENASIFESMGIRQISLTFDDALKSMSPEQFVEMLSKMGVVALAEGRSFRFGRERAGNIDRLKELCAFYDIEVSIVPSVMVADEPVSSSRIRRLIGERDFKSASELMGRHYFLSGRITSGRGVGRFLGYPTANIPMSLQKLYPPNGVYFTKTTIDGTKYYSVTNIGLRPTFAAPEQQVKNLSSENTAFKNTTFKNTTKHTVTENPVTENPAIENPAIENPVAANPDTENPAKENPAEENPAEENPVTENPALENPTIETFILDFDGDAYGKFAIVEFFGFHREERRFENIEKLQSELAIDIAKARAFFSCR